MSIVKTFTGAATAGLLAIGAYTAQAGDEVFWVGETGASWSEAANWVPHAPDAANGDTANFNIESNAVNVVDLDITKTVQDLYVAANTYAVITNSTNEKHTLKTIDSYMTTQAGATLEVTGPNTVVNIVAKKTGSVSGCNNFVKGTQIASGGATLTMNRADPDDNLDQKFIARGAGSKLEFALVRWGNTKTSGNVNNIEYIAEQSGTVTAKGSWRGAVGDAPKYIARSGGTLDVANISSTSTYKIKPCIVSDAATLKVGAVFQGVSGGLVAVTNGTASVSGALSLGDGNYYADVILSGDSPSLVGTSNAGFTFGNTSSSYADRLTFKLAPTPNWSETEGRVRLTYTGSSAKIALRNTVKYEIDCSAFKAWYGTKTVMLMQQKYSSGASYSIPAPAKVTLTGEGASKCAVTFEQSGQNLMMIIDSTNLAGGSVARIGHYGYPTLQAALDAAQDGDTIYLVDDVALTSAAVVNKAVTLDVAAFNVTCDENGFSSTSLFDVTGGSLTVVGTTGMVNGGTNAAIRVSGGAFYSPVASHVTFASETDALVVYNTGVAPTVEICGGRFTSSAGSPVVSQADTGLDPVGEILKGGSYDKEPADFLVSDGYKTEQVGDMWNVVLEGPAICMVGDRYFASLQKAYAATPDYGDLFIVSNATVSTLTLDRNITIWIDIKGHTLKPQEEGGTIFRVTAGTVYLYDNPETGDSPGKLEGGIVVSGGTVKGITMSIDADPALTVNGGTVTATAEMNGGVVLSGGALSLAATVASTNVAITANGGKLNISGGDYVGTNSAFVANGISSGDCNIDSGTFSSEIPVAYLKNNRKMEQQGDRWVVMLSSDESSIVYSWNAGSGMWTNKSNWTSTPVGTRCFGYPSNNKGTVKFPASMATDTEVTLGSSYTVNRIDFLNTNRMKLVLDGAKITIPTGTKYDYHHFEPGKTGPVDIDFKIGAQVVSESGWAFGYLSIGDGHATGLLFELSKTPLTQETAPLRVSGTDAPIMISTNVTFRVDMAAMEMPSNFSSAVTNVLAWSDDGIRCIESTPEDSSPWDKMMSNLEVVNCPAGFKSELVYANGALNLVTRRKNFFMILLK